MTQLPTKPNKRLARSQILSVLAKDLLNTHQVSLAEIMGKFTYQETRQARHYIKRLYKPAYLNKYVELVSSKINATQ